MVCVLSELERLLAVESAGCLVKGQVRSIELPEIPRRYANVFQVGMTR